MIGALISMLTAAGVALFQTSVARAERRRTEQAEALSQMGAAVSSVASVQTRFSHHGQRLALISANAGHIADLVERGDKSAAAQYTEFVKLAWDTELEEAQLRQDLGASIAASSLAYYKLSMAFREVRSLGINPYPEQNPGTFILSFEPNAAQLREYAVSLNKASQAIMAEYVGIGQWANSWSSQLPELQKKVNLP